MSDTTTGIPISLFTQRTGIWLLRSQTTYGDSEDLSKEELIKRQTLRYEQILPGHPKPDEYKLVSMSPYKLQQRCAPSFRVGKVILVADAAHLCNPL
jgi:2-polyprenyl-6-methoxyphenol hydroxylase-like FAD-dependent oxidoreductase